jgi:Heavy metal associated domain 2
MSPKRHTARIAHHTSGRIRLNLAAGKHNQRLLDEIRLLLKPRMGVKDVSVNPATGSIVIEYDSSKWENPKAQVQEAADTSGIFEIAAEPEEVKVLKEGAELLAEHSDLARSVVNFVKDLNSTVKKATNNSVDLNVLIPLAAAIYSFLEVESEAPTPLWLTLGIFSFHSFVALHSQHPHAAQPPM